MDREARPSHLSTQIGKAATKTKRSFRKSFFYYPGQKSRILWVKMAPPARNFIVGTVAVHHSRYSFKNTTEHDLTQIA